MIITTSQWAAPWSQDGTPWGYKTWTVSDTELAGWPIIILEALKLEQGKEVWEPDAGITKESEIVL